MVVGAFVRAFREHFPDLVGQRLLVALSGGSDSVALLHLLLSGGRELGCPVHAVHVHHHLRGADADADASFCGVACRELGVSLEVVHLVPQAPRGTSAEAWWRQERYRLLEDARVRLECTAVATAHTADDQAETVLLKLLRGAGPRGVAGIRRRQGAVVRPLLDFRRAALRAWLNERGVGWREDASNASLERPRGRIRHEVLPLLAIRAPALVEHLAAFAASLAEDDALLASLVRERAELPGVATPIPLAQLATLPPPLLSRWVLELGARLPLAEAPSRRQLAAVAAMVAGRGARAVDLGRRWVLRRRGDRLHLSPPPCRAFSPVAAGVPSERSLPGGFIARLGCSPGDARYRTLLSERLAGAPTVWRSVRSGERLGGERRPLSRGLAAAGVPPEWRRAWPVLEADGTMIWVPGVGVRSGWEAGPATGIVAELEEPWGRSMRW